MRGEGRCLAREQGCQQSQMASNQLIECPAWSKWDARFFFPDPISRNRKDSQALAGTDMETGSGLFASRSPPRYHIDEFLYINIISLIRRPVKSESC